MFNFFKKPKQNTSGGIGPEEAQLLLNAINDQRSRISQAISGSNYTGDTLHAIGLDFGYPETLNFRNFWNMYRRFGIAKNVVELPVDTMWMRNPEIDSTDQFMKEFDKLAEQVSLWVRMKGVDTRQRIGRYGAMFMRVRDGQTPDKPIDIVLNGPGSAMQIIPLNEGQLQVLETDTDPMSERYGLPKMYHFNGGDVGNRNDQIASSFSIHPDRVVTISEDADNGGIYGMSSIEACYNSLMDIRKILGGGGEGFYRNAAQNIVFNLQDGASAKANEALLTKFNEQFDEFSRNRFRRAMWTPGMDATALESDLKDPKDFFFNSLYDVAAASKIPATVLIGQQTGRLASSEDSRAFLSSINSRAENFGTEAVSAVIDWFINHGVLPMAEYSVEWSDLLALSQAEQLADADIMASINEKQFRSGGVVPFDGEEIRETAGLEMRDDLPEVGETDDDGEEDEI